MSNLLSIYWQYRAWVIDASNVRESKLNPLHKKPVLIINKWSFWRIVLVLYSNTESQVEKFQRVEENFAALQAALREIQADNSDKVDIFRQVWPGVLKGQERDLVMIFSTKRLMQGMFTDNALHRKVKRSYKEYWIIIEDQAFSLSSLLASPHPLSPPLPSASCLSFSVFLCVAG